MQLLAKWQSCQEIAGIIYILNWNSKNGDTAKNRYFGCLTQYIAVDFSHHTQCGFRCIHLTNYGIIENGEKNFRKDRLQWNLTF
jgi:hypothetical protein